MFGTFRWIADVINAVRVLCEEYDRMEALGSSASGGLNSKTSYNIMALHPGDKIHQCIYARCGGQVVVVRHIAKYIPGDLVASQPLRANFRFAS